jgi:sugar lactone lactonase YvrE
MRMRIRAGLVVATTTVLLAGVACGTEGDDAGPEGSPEPASALVTFDAKAMEWSEGVAIDSDGDVYASITPQGRLVRIASGSDTAEDFGRVQGIQQGDFGLLGLAVDTDDNVYGTVVSKNKAANGVWRFDAESGDATRVPGTEAIAFANAVAVDGTTLYITDTTGADGKGAVWRVVDDGKAEIWSRDAVLAGDESAGFGFPLGPNGIDVREDVVYVGLTEPAKIAAIPIEVDGSAGDATIFADLTKKGPEGGKIAVDGIDIDDDGSIYVAAVTLHTIYKVSADGETIETVATAEDGLDGPASVAIGEDALYAANFSGALGEVSNKKGPGITRIPL